MRTVFTTQVRVLFCENCGGPLEAAIQGGAVQCSFCKATNAVRPRLDRFQSVAASVSEPERVARLRMQDGVPMTPPASLASLFAGNTIPDYKLSEAFDVFQATRREVKNTQSPEASERLYFLSVVASSTLALKGDFTRVRALLETALDVVVLQRHQNCLRAMLARNAVREGDLGSAEQWLSGCDPRAEDLPSDSNYRVARALIDTARGDFQAVLATLGRSNDEVPIQDALDEAATLVRANAFEKMGNVQTAVQLLRDRMGRSSAFGRQALEQFARIYPSLGLCAASLPQAFAQHGAVAAKSAASRAGGSVGWILIAAGVGSVVFTGVIMAVTMLPMAALPFSQGMPTGAGLAIGATELFVCGIVGATTLLPLGIMGALGWAFVKRSREAAFLRQHGVPAQGTIHTLEGTGARINGVPMVKVGLSYVGPQGPQQASAEMLMPFHLQAQLVPGAQVPLRVHPKDPSKVLIEME
ncbi:MAG: hypothetical protein OHK0013_24440 [Sandaracinaceae bacterium]